MKPKSRGNGQGTAYKRKNSSFWTAEVVVGWRDPSVEGGNPIPIKRTKAGFKTKRDALAYCQRLLHGEKDRPRISLQNVYDQWEQRYSDRVGASTMAGYRAAYKHYAPVHPMPIDAITAQQLQDCMDKCPAGKRTHQLMKVVAGLIWAYAMDSDYVTKDVTSNLYTGKGQSTPWEPITDQEIGVIHNAIGTEPYAEYVFAMCYLGFRPGEFLKLRKDSLCQEEGLYYLVGGSKTTAGKGRRVPVPQFLMPLIQERIAVEGTDLLFPMVQYNRKKEFIGYKEMTDNYFRELVFKPMMKRLGIAEGKVPYGMRHTYADKLKGADGDVKTKAAIMGHTDYDFTRKRYQTTDISDLKQVVESIK